MNKSMYTLFQPSTANVYILIVCNANERACCLALQIIQHSGPLPVSEVGTDMKPVLSRRPERQVSDLTTLRSRSRNSTKPQHLEAGNVEGILTLQLSHPNVVQTFKAATRPLQVLLS